MDKKKLILLVGALSVALVTAVMARSLFFSSSAPESSAIVVPQAQEQGPKVLVATRTLPIGTIITSEMLKYQPWPKELVENVYYLEGQSSNEDLMGTVVRNQITAGQPVTQDSLVKPGERGFLAAALTPGMRAFTVPVSDQTSVAGFVFPGDRVDLMLTQQVEGEGDSLSASETIVRNLRVLATDQRTTPAKNEDGETEVVTYSTVTVEVTPKLAEKISVAQTIGTLTLSLRSLADNQSELEQAIAAGNVHIPDTNDPAEEEKYLARAASRPIETRSSYATGGDVSRFRRSSLPPKKASGEAAKAEEKPKGPVVKVARGNNVTEVPVGRK